jgi:hypothetical protein
MIKEESTRSRRRYWRRLARYGGKKVLVSRAKVVLPMSGPDAPKALELAIEPRNDEYHPDDDRWRDQVASLYRELNAQVDTEPRNLSVPGSKGSIDQIVIALGGAGVFSAMVECFHAWLARDRARSIDVRWDDNGSDRHVTLTGDGLDIESMHEIAKAAAARVGGQPWPASTAPS